MVHAATRSEGIGPSTAVTLTGRERLLARVTESLTIQDIGEDGRVLVSHDVIRIGVLGREARRCEGAGSLLARLVGSLSTCRRTARCSSSRRPARARAPPTPPSFGAPTALRPCGSEMASPWPSHPMASGSRPTRRAAKSLSSGSIRRGRREKAAADGKSRRPVAGDWLPDGKRIVFTSSEPGRGSRVFTMPVDGGAAESPDARGLPDWFSRTVSPDGKSVIVLGPDRKRYFYRAPGRRTATDSRASSRTKRPPAGPPTDGPSMSSAAATFRRESSARRRRPASASSGKSSCPRDGSGIMDISPVIPTPDGLEYVYGYSRTLSDMYVVDGLKGAK